MTMGKPLIDMPNVPEGSGLFEAPSIMLHGARYHVLMDGLDCHIFEEADGGKTWKMLCRFAGSEITERMGIALLRAASVQREAEARRKSG
jgi:hypothetical protein